MITINSNTIEEAVTNLCTKANTQYPCELYEKIYALFVVEKETSKRIKLHNILENIDLARKSRRPLCQDTGQVIVFAKIGRLNICGKNINEAINSAVEKAYKQNFYRKSVVKNSLFDRTNTDTNTPAIIYTELTDTDYIDLKMLIKGAGSENYSTIKMLKPCCSKQEIFEFIKASLKTAGEKACPPYVISIGAGGTMEKAALLSKEAFFNDEESEDEKTFIDDLKNYLKEEMNNILDIKIKSCSTHIACLPVALTINCHSTRHAQCRIREDVIEYAGKDLIPHSIPSENRTLREINASDLKTLKELKAGEDFLLTGEIYTARDAAHEKIAEYFEKNKTLPFVLKDKIIFYAGPCPAAPDEVSGPIGPTTSARMDKYCEFMHKNGLAASIGKGERSEKAVSAIKKYNGKYFSAQGGIACLLAKCVKKSDVIAFDELGTEAVRKLYVERLPLHTEI